MISSDPGVGVIKAGWHCGGNPNTVGSAGTCSACERCQGTQCLPVPDRTPPRNSTNRCEICKSGSRETLPAHTANYAELAQCPDGTVQDDNVQFDIDGCSGGAPDNLESWDNLPFAINYNLYVTNPIWGTVRGRISRATGVKDTLACNAHDVCYQTCGSNKATCDNALGATITASCDIGYPSACPYTDQDQCIEIHGGIQQLSRNRSGLCARCLDEYRTERLSAAAT